MISPPEPLTNAGAHEPDLCLDPSGRLWIVWNQTGDGDGDWIALRTPAADSSSPAIRCSGRRGIETAPTIVALSNGGAVVAWTAFREGVWQLLARIIASPAAGKSITLDELGDESLLLSQAEGISRPRLALDAGGTPWLICEVARGKGGELRVFKLRTTGWSSATTLATPPGICRRASLAIGPDSGLWAAYDCYRDGYQIYLQRIDRQSSAISVTDNPYQNVHPAIAGDGDGNLWIAWASNRNDATKDPWWLTKWVHLRRFDGLGFRDPPGPLPGSDLYSEEIVQGWEFPAVQVDRNGRVWLFGQGSHTHYAQSLDVDGWSPLFEIAHRRWGTWKPRFRIAGDGPIHLASMGLDGAQLQTLEIGDGSPPSALTSASEPPPLPFWSSGGGSNGRLAERPTVVAASGESYRLYFGDLHAHTVYGDAVGDIDELYSRYRDGYGYDFACATEHDFLAGMELSDSELRFLWTQADAFSEAGVFIALPGYEWTSPAVPNPEDPGRPVGEGHRHVLFRNGSGKMVRYGGRNAATSGAELLSRLAGQDALVIPHHTGWSGTDWSAHDPQLQRVVEICSVHGRFEHAGNLPIGHRRDRVRQEEFVEEALRRGYRLGFVGGSDGHGLLWQGVEQQGRDRHVPAGTRIGWKRDGYRTGMTVVLAPELTRDAIFDALYARRCYATSGVPIELEFSVAGAIMGSEIEASGPVRAVARVTGTAPLRSLELVRSGRVISCLQAMPGSSQLTVSFAAEDAMPIPGEEHYYYLRIVQEDGNMAWSSPIWVTSR